jgi:hypothetical protein
MQIQTQKISNKISINTKKRENDNQTSPIREPKGSINKFGGQQEFKNTSEKFNLNLVYD